MEKRVWFKAKRYGWGWYPATWEGWFITLVYAVLVAIAAGRPILVDEQGFGVVLDTVIPIVIATTILIIVCYRTGEKPRWRWGDDETTN